MIDAASPDHTHPNETLRVGILVQSSDWLGGRNYLRNLVAAMQVLPTGPITPVIFTGQKGEDLAGIFPGTRIVRTSLLDRESPAWIVRKAISKTISRDPLLERLLRTNKIDILSHSGSLPNQSSIAVVGWIPDFQHLHLPDFFSKEERAKRDREFDDVCRHCHAIIVSSECAAHDLRAFSPGNADKAEVMRFVASPAPAQAAAPLSDLRQLYSFNGPFFLLPNQFWAHKNHAVVVRALKLLRDQGRNLTVLATGVTKDYRQPSSFSNLMKLTDEYGVLENFRVLGAIPFDHLAGLMRDTVAFINPSYFEGWSTSVEEAKSLGKAVILSDIPVHREQAPERGLFFDPSNPESLAEALVTVAEHYNSEADQAQQTKARSRFQQRQEAFGNNYHRILLTALHRQRNGNSGGG